MTKGFVWKSQAFLHAGELRPRCNKSGNVELLSPALRYANTRNVPQHQYGVGPFCEFRIRLPNEAGVYALLGNGALKYIGRTENLDARFYAYGHISPKNCFVGGRSTNCRINAIICQAYVNGGTIDVFYWVTHDYVAVEVQMISDLTPPWNVQTPNEARSNRMPPIQC